MADTIYGFDSAQIDVLCGAYRGAGPLPRAFYTSPEVFNADMEPHLAAPLALCRAYLPDPQRPATG